MMVRYRADITREKLFLKRSDEPKKTKKFQKSCLQSLKSVIYYVSVARRKRWAARLIDHKKLQEFLKNAEIKNFKNFSKAACKVLKP